MIRRRIDRLPVIEKVRKGPPTLKGILTSNHVLEYMLPLLQKNTRHNRGLNSRWAGNCSSLCSSTGNTRWYKLELINCLYLPHIFLVRKRTCLVWYSIETGGGKRRMMLLISHGLLRLFSN